MIKIKDNDIQIFIVDDDELLIKILQTKFKQNTNYKITTFTSGDDFLSFYKNLPKPKKQVHILVLDYLLKPHEPLQTSKNGIHYLQEVKKINPDIQVLLISAVDNPDIAIQAQNSGALAFIKKNENAFLRISNQINFIISDLQLRKAHKRSLLTRQIFFSLLVAFALFIIYIFISDLLSS
ncbi:MAG: response regulator [Bacteroidales bacterium]|nr:response regulator [Bacteroidales bacterium]